MFNLKNAISPVIAVILLLVITVVISMSMYSFLESYTDSTTSSLSSNEILSSVEIKHLFSNQLFLESEKNVNLSLLRISDSSGIELCSFLGDTEINSSGLVGHWTFDELIFNGTHYIVEDLSGNGNNGTLLDENHSNQDGNTLPQLIESNNGMALKFDGVDDYIEVLDDNSLDIITNISLVVLFNQEKSNTVGQNLLSKKELANTNYKLVARPDKQFYSFGIRGPGGNLEQGIYRSHENYKFNQNKFLFVSHESNKNNSIILNTDNNVENGFWDISLPQFKPGNFSMIANNAPLRFGADELDSGTLTRFFKGEIDEIRIYNRRLNTDEVKILYWNMIKNQQSGISQIDLSSCNLQKNQEYKIIMIANGEKIESTQIVN